MAKIKLNGDTSGYIDISAPAVSGNNTLELGPGTKILTNLDNTFTGIATFSNGIHITSGGFILNQQRSDTHASLIIDKPDAGTGTLKFFNNGSASAYIQHTNAERLDYYLPSGSGSQVFYTNATERLRIDSSGNVNFGAEKTVSFPSGTGIQVYNSSAPRIKLVNDTTGNAAGDGLQIYVSGSSAIFDQKENAEMRFYTNATERLRITSTGKCEVYKGTSTTGKTSGSEAFTVGNGAGNKRFSVYPDGTTVIGGQGIIGNYNILLQNDGQSYFGARMKIGTTTEGEANADDLTVATSGHTGMTIRSGTANRGNIYFSDGTSGDAEYRGYVTYDHDGDKFKFGTANADRFVITSAGNLQVKGGNLHLDSNAELALFEDNTSGSYNNSAKIAFDFSGSVARMRSSTNGSATIKPLAFYIANTPAIFIGTDGNVAIGVNSPEARLHVEENLSHSSTYYLNADAHILIDNPGSGKSVLKLEGEAALVYGGGSNKLYVADRQNERFRINENGNTIFQGAASPSNGLTGNAAMLVRGKTVDGSSTTVDLNISQSYSTNGVGIEINEYSNNANALATLVFNHGSLKSMIACSRVVTNNWGTDLRFYTHDDSTTGSNQHKTYERLRIDSSGRVGINRSSPSQMLHMSGAIRQDGSGNNCQYHQVCYSFDSGTHTLFTLSGNGVDATAMAVFEFVCLYAYAGTNHCAGIDYASTRRTNSNSAWQVTNNQNVTVSGNDTSIVPNLFWDNGVLKITVNGSVQCTGTLRLSTRRFSVARNYSAG